MASSYPASFDATFPGWPYTDNTEFILAAFGNSWVSAIQAIEQTVGYGSGSSSSNPLYSPEYNKTFSTLASRMANVEVEAAGGITLDPAAGDIGPIGPEAIAGATGMGADAGHGHAGVTSFDGRQGVVVIALADIGSIFTASGQVLLGTGPGTAQLIAATDLLPAATSDWNSGDLKWTSSLTLPNGWLWANGAAVDRGIYANLMSATTVSATATLVSGSTLITNIPSSATQWMAQGQSIEVPGYLPSGTKIQSVGSTSITVTNQASSGGTPTITVFPNGNGDGSTTFNVFDSRGRTMVGFGGPGGNAQPTLAMGSVGGEQTHILTSTEGFPHVHGLTISDLGHVHGYLIVPFTPGGNAPFADFEIPAEITNPANTSIGYANISASMSSAGGGIAHNNMQPYAVAMAQVKT